MNLSCALDLRDEARHVPRDNLLAHLLEERIRHVDPGCIERAQDKLPYALVLDQPEELAPFVGDRCLAAGAAPISVLEPHAVIDEAIAAKARELLPEGGLIPDGRPEVSVLQWMCASGGRCEHRTHCFVVPRHPESPVPLLWHARQVPPHAFGFGDLRSAIELRAFAVYWVQR